MTAEVETVMASLKTQLAAAYPARTVTRDLLDFDDREKSLLQAGIYTVLAGAEDGYPNYRGREGNFGVMRPVLVAQVEVSETHPPTPSAIEAAESTMIDEIKAFTRSAMAAPIDSLVVTAIRRSGQLEYPYGWVSFQMELMLS